MEVNIKKPNVMFGFFILSQTVFDYTGGFFDDE